MVGRIILGVLCAAPLLSCGGARSASQREPAPALASAEAPPAPPAVARATVLEAEPERTPADAPHESDAADRDAALNERYAWHGVAFHVLAQVFEKPDTSSFVIGHVRRGTSVRASEPVKGSGCSSSWHELWTGGYVCRGRGFQLGRAPQTFTPSPAPAALFDAVPYPYAKSIAPSSLQFFRVPTLDEQRQAEAAYAALLADDDDKSAPPAPPEPGTEPGERELPFPELVRMPMAPGFYVSVDGVESDGERSFARTVRGGFVEQKTLAEVALPKAAGGPIGSDERFPFALVYREGAKLVQRDAATGALGESQPLPRYTRLALLEGQAAARALPGYHLTRSGQMVADAKLRIPPRVVRPAVVPKHARLIHVHLATQTLVAYDGERPVYATLVSSGKEGFETPLGLYRIHAKHVSATMDGLAGEEDEYSIEDVPWTLYFHGSFALHAAFWHDKFGNTRSHGCVNLSPADARWLFEWSTPTLPAGFHNAMSTRENPGTYVLID